jgi:hypothetical protein
MNVRIRWAFADVEIFAFGRRTLCQRPSSGFVGSWRTTASLLARANGFLRFRRSIDLSTAYTEKEPGSFREAVEALGAMD